MQMRPGSFRANTDPPCIRATALTSARPGEDTIDLRADHHFLERFNRTDRFDLVPQVASFGGDSADRHRGLRCGLLLALPAARITEGGKGEHSRPSDQKGGFAASARELQQRYGIGHSARLDVRAGRYADVNMTILSAKHPDHEDQRPDLRGAWSARPNRNISGQGGE